MPTRERLEQFIAKVEGNKHDEAIEEFYAVDATMQENQSEPRVGRDNLVANERKLLSKVKKLSSKCIHPIFINGDYVVIRWLFHFEWKDGTSNRIEEIAYQHWKDEYIVAEKFFYDPQQFEPK